MKIYLTGPAETGDEYVEAKARLELLGHEVICNPVEQPNLRLAIAELTTCDAICLLEVWWASLVATQLQTVASWLHLHHVDTLGRRVPTSGLRNL